MYIAAIIIIFNAPVVGENGPKNVVGENGPNNAYTAIVVFLIVILLSLDHL